MYQLLVIGTLPSTSGIGGVTIHVQRLLDYMDQRGYSYIFKDYRVESIFVLVKSIFKSSLVHIHVSNIYLQLFLVLISKFFSKKSIVTIHGNLGRYGKLKNSVVCLCVKLCSIPIALNNQSFEKGLRLNQNCVLIPAFIPPIKEESLPQYIIKKIDSFISRGYQKLFSTNAFSLSFDKNKKETYGISELLFVFEKLPQYGLIFSDPSGTYIEWLIKNNFRIPSNILILNGEHSFYEVIKRTNGVIRNTSTDGDSLSIKEALFLGKHVICTDVVSRHAACVVYKCGEVMALINILSSIDVSANCNCLIQNGAEDILKLYKKNETNNSRFKEWSNHS